jgi:hypothetical protein
MDAQWDIVAPTQPQAASVDQLHEYLTQKISTYFMYNPKPVKVFLTGGIDTLLIYSYIKKIDAPHVMVDGLYIEFDEFYLRNSFDIQAHRFYQQVHHWTSPSVLSSGAPGDEFMLRSPVTADLYLRNHGTSMRDQLRDHPDCYHYQYFTSAKNLAVFDKQAQEFVPRADLTRYLSNILVNDWQHWHLGNTLTWTPLRDLDITKMILNLPFELVRDQILDSAVSRQLIERNCPGLSGILSSQKNTGNLWQRFVDTILNHPK